MTDYWDYLKQSFKDQWYNPAGAVTSAIDAYLDMSYDNANGADKYWLTKIPGWGNSKKWEDESQFWQNYYDITGKNPNYSTSYGNSNPLGTAVGLSAGASGIARMARSLTEVYGAEIVENLQTKFNHSYW